MAEPSYTGHLLGEIRAQARAWDDAEGWGREHDAAEAGFRAFTALDTSLAGGGELPPGWALSHAPPAPPAAPADGPPPVRVLVQQRDGRWVMPAPESALPDLLEAAGSPAMLGTVAADGRARWRGAARAFLAALDRADGRLPLIGREARLVKTLAGQLRRAAHTTQVTPLRDYGEHGRGWHFDLELTDPDGASTGRVARVTVTLDRVFRHCTTHGRAHDDDGDRTCRWEGDPS